MSDTVRDDECIPGLPRASFDAEKNRNVRIYWSAPPPPGGPPSLGYNAYPLLFKTWFTVPRNAGFDGGNLSILADSGLIHPSLLVALLRPIFPPWGVR